MAEIVNIELKDGEPVTLTAKLTTEEAAWIASRAGETTNDPTGRSLWDGFTGEFFNRFWHAGVQGYMDGDEPK